MYTFNYILQCTKNTQHDNIKFKRWSPRLKIVYSIFVIVPVITYNLVTDQWWQKQNTNYKIKENGK